MELKRRGKVVWFQTDHGMLKDLDSGELFYIPDNIAPRILRAGEPVSYTEDGKSVQIRSATTIECLIN